MPISDILAPERGRCNLWTVATGLIEVERVWISGAG